MEGNAKPRLRTLFVGGGTPTHFPAPVLSQFLNCLRKHFDLSKLAEWTMEANPEDITQEKLRLMSDHGVNRVSLGIQSFDDKKLGVLERSHSSTQATEIVQQTAETIANVSIDLIFGAPGETLSGWQNDLQIATSLPITHVSTYALTFEKGTSFWTRRNRGDLDAVDEFNEIAMYDAAREVFAADGLQHYEISSFAREGFRCQHNLAYWQGDGWYAAGPGAAGYVDGVRMVNHRSTTTYLKRIEKGESPLAESEPISREQAAREQAAFGVRMIDGVDLRQIRERHGFDLEVECDEGLQRLLGQGLIQKHNGHVRLTDRGIHFADTVASEFLG